MLRKLAAELQTYFVDLNQSTKNLFNELGPAESAYISLRDGAHFSLVGSEVIAGLVVKEFPGILQSQVLSSAPPEEVP